MVRDWSLGSDGGLRFTCRFVIPELEELGKVILEEARKTQYSMHPGET